MHCHALRSPLSIGEKDHRERHIARTAGKAGLQPFHDLGARGCGGQRGADIAQHAQLTFADHPLGDLGHNAQHAGGRTRVVGERRVGEGVIGFLGEPAALQVQQQGFVPGRLACGENMLDTRPDIGPNLRPYLVRPAADHPVALQTDGRQVSVVTEERQFRTPGHPHSETRR